MMIKYTLHSFCTFFRHFCVIKIVCILKFLNALKKNLLKYISNIKARPHRAAGSGALQQPAQVGVRGDVRPRGG